MSSENEAFERLETFRADNDVTSKGQLSTVIQVTFMVKGKPMPLNPDDFKTEKEGQVKGLGGGNLKKILKQHGITRTLSSEGGRTSRGSMGLVRHYFEFLNDWHDEAGHVDLDYVERYWADRVVDYFNSEPFILAADVSRTMSDCVNDVFNQARKRQAENPGTHYLGTVLQHLVAAKLSLVLPEGSLEIHGASVADAPTGRAGDFLVGDTAIHCTTMPGAPLMEKCAANIRSGLHPVIITIAERAQVAASLIEDNGLVGKVEVCDAQQFLSANVLEHSLFNSSMRGEFVARLVARYNDIVDAYETDPSLCIAFDLG